MHFVLRISQSKTWYSGMVGLLQCGSSWVTVTRAAVVDLVQSLGGIGWRGDGWSKRFEGEVTKVYLGEEG